MKKTHKILAYCMIGSLSFLGGTAVAEGAETPVAGIDLLLHDVYLSNEDVQDKIENYLLSAISSEYKDLTFAKVTNYVNIRSKASEDGDILGKLYNNSAATILEKAGDWYKVKSGSVKGYIKGEFLVTGQEALELSKTVGTRIATVNTETLRVREKANTEASIVSLVPVGEELVVKKEQDNWIKVSLNEGTGYVSADYVKLQTIYEEAVSIEEEQERLAAEEEAREAQERKMRATKSSSKSGNTSGNTSGDNSSKQSTYKNESNASNSSLRSKIVTYAKQFEGNPYVWGGTSLTNGADCSGFTQSVFEDYGIYIPRTSRSQAASGRRVSLDNMKPGDLIFYAKNGTINHVALYIGNGKVISASSPRTGIRITNYNYRTPVKAVSYIN